MSKLDGYLKVGEAAAYLGVARNTLRNWAEAGKIMVHRNAVNGYRLFKKSDLDELLKQTERSAIPTPRKPK